MKGYRRLLGFMVDQNFERKAPGEFAPCCPMDACKPDRYAKSDQSWEGELSLGLSWPMVVQEAKNFE